MAEEVRKLAVQTSTASERIKGIIKEIQYASEQAEVPMDKVRNSSMEVMANVGKVDDLMAALESMSKVVIEVFE